MDSLLELAVIAVCLVIGMAVAGCVFGIVGWRRANRALAELALLRSAVAAGVAPAPVPAASLWDRRPAPPPLPEAIREAPAAEAPPLPDMPPPAPPEPRKRLDIEVLLTQRWGIWLGAAALLMAGVFLVRTAIEQGMMGPGPRCAIGGLLGLALVAGAWWARGRPAGRLPLADQAPAALAAGGVAVLFAAAYGAGPLYGLVPEPVGFVLLAVAGLVGLGLSLVFGPIVGAVGLVAAFATPALVQTDDPSLPGLFAYLFVVSAASWAVVLLMAWVWLGWGAALGGAIWVLLSAFLPAGTAFWAPGLFVPAAAALTLALLPRAALDSVEGRRFVWAPMLLLGLAGLVVAGQTGEPAVRLGLFLLAPVAMAKAWSDPRVAWLPLVTAALAVLTLLSWAVPFWVPTDEAITIEGVVQAVLPGAWAPGAIVPLLETALAVALLHAGAGAWMERRSANPLPWAVLVGTVPVALLAATYVQVGRFQERPVWALAAAGLAVLLVGAAALARRDAVLPLQRAGVHATAAVAALALGCAIVLDAAWLTVALALMLPALAWIERAAALPALRRVALVVAGVVLVRLVLNPAVAGYDFGTTPVLNLVLVAYGIPAACFGVAAGLFRRRGADAVVAVLEAGAALFFGLLLVFEVRHAAVGGALLGPDPGFAELAWVTTLLGAYAVLLLAVAGRIGRPVLAAAGRIAGGLALLGGTGLLVQNPFWSQADLGPNLVFNALVPAYVLPALLAGLALQRGVTPRKPIGFYALLAALMAVSAYVRQWFHPGRTSVWYQPVTDAELWAYSGVWLLLAAAVLGSGLWLRERSLRLAGLALVTLVAGKVFLVDMSGLEGLWRVLSFLGLGLGLIGLGALYRRFGERA